MKKFWIVLLSLGLVAAFCMPAAAVEVKWSGSYIITGSYENNRGFLADSVSTAFYAQRLRLEPQFKVAEGLTLNTRFDALERVWGQNGVGAEATDTASERNTAQEQNIQFRRCWVEFNVPFGQFWAGYMPDGIFGIGSFGSLDSEGPTFFFLTKLGPIVPIIGWEKVLEGGVSQGKPDTDFDKYFVGATYYGRPGEIGLLWVWYKNDAGAPGGYKQSWYWLESHGKYTWGPLFAEYEFVYEWGKQLLWQNGLNAVMGPDVDVSALEYYVNLKYTAGPAYVGFQYGFNSGTDWDKLKSDHKDTGFMIPGYGVWQPTLILYNDWMDRFAGSYGKTLANPAFANNFNAFANGGSFADANLFQLYAGYNPIPKLGLKASIAYVVADTTLPNQDDKIGTEFDMQAAYKIYDNLEYMVGFGYLWVGDYWKGGNASVKIDDDYLIINQLTLSF